MTLGLLPISALAVDNITVYVDFEGYNLGQGYYIQPTKLTLPAGTTVGAATSTLLSQTGYTGNGLPSYLSRVNFNAGDIDIEDIPSYLTDQNYFEDLFDGEDHGSGLGETDYTPFSGWMYTVNHVIDSNGASACILQDGDVVRWQFTLWGYGLDLGLGAWEEDWGFGTKAYYDHADKTALIRALCADGVDIAAKQAALAVAINPLATPAQIANALAALTTVPADYWFTVSLSGNATATDMMNKINALLVSDFGQTAGSYNYSVVKKLKLMGNITSLAAVPFDNAATRSALAASLTDVDMVDLTASNAPRFGNGSTSPPATLVTYTALERVVMPKATTVSYGTMFYGCSKLKSVTANPPTGSGNYGTFGADGMFNGCTSLEEIIFTGATAPTTFNGSTWTGSNNANASARVVIAYVPDPAAGGYANSAFTSQFAAVLKTGDPALKTYAELQGLITLANTQSENDYTPVTWTPFANALAAAKNVVDTATLLVVDAAYKALSTALGGLELMPTTEPTTIKVTKGAAVGVYLKGTNHFAPFTSYAVMKNTAKSDADPAYDYFESHFPINSSGNLLITASKDGYAKYARFLSVPDYGMTFTADLTGVGAWGVVDNGYMNANLYTNLDDTGTVNLAPGGTFELDTFRVWQAMAGFTQNRFVEPDYTFEICGSSAGIERIGSPGRERLKITALTNGVSVIKITYGPLEYVDSSGTQKFNAIDPRNTGVVVVNVGGGGSFNTGITARNDFDTYYFDKSAGYRDFTFTPATGSTVRVHDPLNISEWGSGWTNYAASADGSFTVKLRDGRNIIEIKNGGAVKFHVVKARGIDVTVANTTHPGQPFAVGDTAQITLRGLETPIEKLAGVYNPGFSTLAPYIRYTDGAANFDSKKGAQYASLTTDFSVNYVFSGNKTVLNGQIWIGSMGSDVGAHRSIPPAGLPANMNASAIGPFGFGALPEIVLEVDTTPPAGPAYETALNGALSWIGANTTNPTVGSVGGEWAVLDLARAGVTENAWVDKYLQNLDAALADGTIITKWTDYERVTIAITALGLDASDYKGTDLTAAFKTYVATASRPSQNKTINADIFALIALKSKPYGGDTDKYVDALLNAQLSDGSWTLAFSGDIDMTAMAIQALAPYYGNADVKASVDKALAWLYGKTINDAERNAQIIVALSALNMDAANYVDELLTYYDAATGAFKRSGATNQMTTEQAAYALVAYDRFVNHKNTLYDMSDAFDATPGSDTITKSDAGAASVTAEEMAAALKAAKGKSNTITIDASGATSLALPAASAEAAKAAGVAIKAKLRDAELTLPPAALASLGAAGDVVVTALGKTPSYQIDRVSGLIAVELSITANGAPVSSFAGGVQVRVPYALQAGKQAAQVAAYYMPASGTPEKLGGVSYANGYAAFTAQHFSEYGIGASDATTIKVGDASGRPGSEVKVPVSIIGNPGFWGYSLMLEYPAVLELTKLEKGDFDGSFVANIDAGVALLNESILAADEGSERALDSYTQDGALFYATFRIPGSAALGTEYTVSAKLTPATDGGGNDVSAENFINADGDPVAAEFESGKITAYKDSPTLADIQYDAMPVTATYNGAQQTVAVTKKTDGIGDIDVYYEGSGGTAYAKSKTAPINAGTYTVTVEIAESAGYAAATLTLGALTINKQALALTWPTTSGTYLPGTALKDVALLGADTAQGAFAWADGNETIGAADGSYAVTFTPKAPYNDGNYSYPTTGYVNVSTGTKAAPTLADLTYSIPAGAVYSGSAVAVAVTGRPGMGAITVYYNGSTTAPANAGSYAVTAMIAEGSAYLATPSPLALGTLVIAKMQIDIDWPALNSTVAKGTKLGDISFSSAYGTFAWALPGDTAVFADGDYALVFTPGASYPESNYDFGNKTGSVRITVDGRLKGDGDNDGHITIADLQLLSKLVAKVATGLTDADKAALDMNGDGAHTVADLQLLAKLFIGLQ